MSNVKVERRLQQWHIRESPTLNLQVRARKHSVQRVNVLGAKHDTIMLEDGRPELAREDGVLWSNGEIRNRNVTSRAQQIEGILQRCSPVGYHGQRVRHGYYINGACRCVEVDEFRKKGRVLSSCYIPAAGRPATCGEVASPSTNRTILSHPGFARTRWAAISNKGLQCVWQTCHM